MRSSIAFVIVVLAALACSTPGAAPPSPRAPVPIPIPAAVLPLPPTPLSPAQTLVAGSLTGDTVTETESCAGCHADAAEQWRSSGHAFGSFNNPVYRVAVDRFRGAVSNDASRFCGACHDVALLVDGAMSHDVAPSDPRAHGGITCRVCHGIEATRPDGNGSYVLASSPIPIPRDGDDESLRAHKARMALAPLRTAAMCGTCHRSFLSPETGNAAHLIGQDEVGAWERSVYAGSLATRVDDRVDPAECRTCHMPLEAAPHGDAATKDGRIRSHRFAGAQTWLAAMRGDRAQLDADQAMLRGAASIDVAVATSSDGTRTLPADGAPVQAGTAMTFDVVIRNEHAGHRFPAGVLDAQDTWVEVTVDDARGQRLAEAGTSQQASGDDPSAHVLRAVQADEHGTPLFLRETDRFRAPVFNHTIAPRDAELVRYRFDAPKDLPPASLPLRVTARLRHRSRNHALAQAVCADAHTPRGKAFAREVAERTGSPIDGCAAEPVTEVAASQVWIGDGWEARTKPGDTPVWRRLYAHALGLLHALQEDVDLARPSLALALDRVPAGDDRARAMVLDALAKVAIREGRTDEALTLLGEADALLPGHPAIAHARGQALADIWRWKDATRPLDEAARATPLDDTLWAHLAIAYGSADEPRAALDAASHALALAPRRLAGRPGANARRLRAVEAAGRRAGREERLRQGVLVVRARARAGPHPRDAPGRISVVAWYDRTMSVSAPAPKARRAALVREPTPRDMTRVEFARLGEQGFFGDERVELVRGVVMQMPPIGTMHASVVDRLNEILVIGLHGKATVRVQLPLAAADDSQPQPDFAVVPRVSYTREHPQEALWVIEVADTSLRYDRTVKAELYAACGVPEYWVVDVNARAVDVNRQPTRDGYGWKERIDAGTIASLAFPGLAIDLGLLFAT